MNITEKNIEDIYQHFDDNDHGDILASMLLATIKIAFTENDVAYIAMPHPIESIVNSQSTTDENLNYIEAYTTREGLDKNHVLHTIIDAADAFIDLVLSGESDPASLTGLASLLNIEERDLLEYRVGTRKILVGGSPDTSCDDYNTIFVLTRGTYKEMVAAYAMNLCMDPVFKAAWDSARFAAPRTTLIGVTIADDEMITAVTDKEPHKILEYSPYGLLPFPALLSGNKTNSAKAKRCMVLDIYDDICVL